MTNDMMHRKQLVDAVTAGMWLIGIGVLFATRFWCPGIMFLIGVTAFLQGRLRGHPWYSIQGGFWAIFIGVWAIFRFSMAVFFVGLGLWVIFVAFTKPPPFQKPVVDNTLE
jgi:hypothetical protein